MTYSFKISTVSQADLKLLSYYNLPWPEDDFNPWQTENMLGSGNVRTTGLSSCVWHWGFLKSAQYAILIASPLLTTRSGTIWIRTLDENEAYQDYLGKYFFPRCRFSAGRAIDVNVVFKALVKL